MHPCEFCKKMLSTKSSLNNHQKTTKYCLKIQKKTGIEYQCPGCKKVSTKKEQYDRHTESCKMIDIMVERQKVTDLQRQLTEQKRKYKARKEKYESQISEQTERYEAQLAKKDETIERLASQAITRPTTTNNTQNNILSAPFTHTQESTKAIFDANYDETYFLDGPKGLARFVHKLILKTEDGETIYACFDQSRNVFKYKDEDGNIIKDLKAKKLLEIIYPAAVERGLSIATKFMEEFSVIQSADHDVVEAARIRSDLATDSFLGTKRLKDEPEPFARELAVLTSCR
jgi:hypothetical protein